MVSSIVDFSKAITVKRVNRSFIVTHLETGETVTLKSSDFFGNFFKYVGEFHKKFRETFPDKEVDILIISEEASRLISDLLFFNRADN